MSDAVRDFSASKPNNLLKEKLLDILNNKELDCWFQPIIDLPERQILGYEALARGPENSDLHSPAALFGIAEQTGLTRQLEHACIESAIDRFMTLQLPGKLFINIAAADLDQLDNPQAPISSTLTHYAKQLDIVLEISEKYPFKDYQRIREIADYCHSIGLELAIDDLGSGYSGLRTWAEIRPEFVKVDMHFVVDIHKDSVKREFVRSICEIARGLNCHVIAEGIEQPLELETLRNLGINLAQGFIFQRPQANPASDLLPLNELLVSNATIPLRQLKTRPSETVGELLKPFTPITPEMTAEDVNDRFISAPGTSSIPIVDGKKAVGMIYKTRIQELFSGRFSHQLYGKKPIREFMHKTPIQVDHQSRLEEVSQRITDSNSADLNNDFIISRNGLYAGVGKVSDLLKCITDYQVRYARYSNPLTLLPGNVPLYEWVDQLIDEQQRFYIAYVDLNNFKPFNDYFGYSRGDEVLVALSDILNSIIQPERDMVCHVGGDDFVILFRNKNWREQCEQILDRFDREKTRFYCQQALDEGGIRGQDRKGREAFFGLLTISIGVAHPDYRRCSSHHHVAQLASDAKKQAKIRGRDQNYIFLSRRRGPTKKVAPEASHRPLLDSDQQG